MVNTCRVDGAAGSLTMFYFTILLKTDNECISVLSKKLIMFF